MGKKVHVVPHGDQWAVKTDNSQKAYKATETQREAIDIARDVAKNQESELVIHGKDGRIQEKDSFGNDDYPPKG